jgi:GntR family transcriptional regulator, rspAB operon transcriptional repressor
MTSLKATIIEQLKSEILSLTLTPGTIISESTLTERFGLSRTPIRDILKQLSLEGYIDIYPQRGSIVSYINMDSVKQIIYLRNALEKEITSDLCTTLTVRGHQELLDILEQQKKCLSIESPFHQFLKLDDAFHRTLFSLAGRDFIWDVIQQFNVHYMRYRQLNMLKKDKLIEIHSEHQLLLKHIVKGEKEELVQIIQHHLRGDVESIYFEDNFKNLLKYNL